MTTQDHEQTQRFEKGDRVRLTVEASKHYGAQLDGWIPYQIQYAELTVQHIATEHGAPNGPDGTHPGFDEATGCALYDVEELPVSLYDYELV